MIIKLNNVPLSLALSLLRDLDNKISPDVNQGFELLLNWMIFLSKLHQFLHRLKEIQ